MPESVCGWPEQAAGFELRNRLLLCCWNLGDGFHGGLKALFPQDPQNVICQCIEGGKLVLLFTSSRNRVRQTSKVIKLLMASIKRTLDFKVAERRENKVFTVAKSPPGPGNG